MHSPIPTILPKGQSVAVIYRLETSVQTIGAGQTLDIGEMAVAWSMQHESETRLKLPKIKIPTQAFNIVVGKRI
jgi:hypothetical protein